MSIGVQGQATWGRGIVRGRNAPPDSVYDAVNALVDDEGNLFKRGGSAYRSSSDTAAAIEGLFDGYLAGGLRTVFWSETAEDVYTLDSNDATLITVSTGNEAVWRRFSRGAVVAGVLFLPGIEFASIASLAPIGYGGSRKTSAATTFSGTATNGSTTITASGTSWLTTADAGMIALGAGGVLTGTRGVVRSITSNTSLELVDPWSGATGSGTMALLRFEQTSLIAAANTDTVYVTSAGGRLVAAQGSRVYFTPPGLPFGGNPATDFHQLPEGAIAIGADAILDTAIIFTTAGVWRITNMALDPIDDAGNVQHQVESISKDVILWGDPGIAAWAGALVVPAVDDVFVFAPSGETRVVSAAIRSLYRSYVKAGYQPGIASVHRGHYFLPILNGTTVINTLVCRLDREETPWTRWTGHAAGGAYAQRIGATTRTPKLLGISAERVTDLTDCFAPAAANAADANTAEVQVTIITRDFPTSGTNHPGTVVRARLRYEMTDDGNGATDAADVRLEYSSDQDAGLFTMITSPGLESSASAGGGLSDGSTYSWWPVGKKRERMRFKVTTRNQAGTFILRTLELLSRQSGLR